MRRLALIAVLSLAACGTALLPGGDPAPTATITPAATTPAAAGLAATTPAATGLAATAPAATAADLQRIACDRRGGRLTPGPGPGSLVCTVTPRDAGRSCTRSTDCDGECLARSRTCAPVIPLRGCHDVLDSRGRPTQLCLD